MQWSKWCFCHHWARDVLYGENLQYSSTFGSWDQCCHHYFHTLSKFDSSLRENWGLKSELRRKKNPRKLFCLPAKWIIRAGPACPRQASNALLRMKSYLEIVFWSSLVRMRHEINLQMKDFGVDKSKNAILPNFLRPRHKFVFCKFLQKFFFFMQRTLFGDFDDNMGKCFSSKEYWRKEKEKDLYDVRQQKWSHETKGRRAKCRKMVLMWQLLRLNKCHANKNDSPSWK